MPFIGPYIKKLIGGKMKVKVMKLDAGAIIPKYAKPGDAGMDLMPYLNRLMTMATTFTEQV